MPHIKSKYFPFLLAFSAIIVEVCAVFFSVYGLMKLFSGAAIAIGIMAASLEIAKVTSASYLYRYWEEISKFFKSYMTMAVVILMLITSLGIYGFLSNAFQSSTIGFEKEAAKMILYEDEITRIKEDNNILKSEKNDLRNSMNAELSGLTIKDESRYVDVNKRTAVSKRYQSLIKEKDKEITFNNGKIESFSKQINDLKITMIDTGADVGPIIFVSRAFGLDVSTVVQYLILLFIIVFDPLALALIIALNKVVIENHEADEPKIKKNVIEAKEEIKEKITEAEPTQTAKLEEVAIPKQESHENKEPIQANVKNLIQRYDDGGITYIDTEKESRKISGPIQTTGFY